MEKILIIVGPTAVGKSDLAIRLAKKFNGEIISGDSLQIYRKLDIGTAKTLPKEQAGIPHYLIDTKSIDEENSVVDFVRDAETLIQQIANRGKLPIIAGGTGYYIQALINGLALGGENSSNSQIKAELEKELALTDSEHMWRQLNEVDQAAATKIPKTNARKIIRALEVYRVTGNKFSKQKNQAPRYDALIIGLNCDRSLLYQRINSRVDNMMENGLLQENEWLYNHGGLNNPAGKGIGYREFDLYFNDNQSLSDTIDQIKQDSRHYAKRQLTWFRNKLKTKWFNLVEHPEEIDEIDSLVNKWR
ncbi:tRNA (adenosine(37)-N6)-dimethylallyltransferase MiaA [Fructilactobacillus frigidiflavus]|uniref:tRNA (adenosine(37)-N6)-dimethylallyltransferase MiaA n=1 Tax=Fructilactobacillus frigidiflavus TaxID=3242688 RepID=UPI0037580C22